MVVRTMEGLWEPQIVGQRAVIASQLMSSSSPKKSFSGFWHYLIVLWQKSSGFSHQHHIFTSQKTSSGLQVTWKDDPRLGSIHSCFSSGFLRMYSSVVGRVLEGQRHHQRNQVHWDSKRTEGHLKGGKNCIPMIFQWFQGIYKIKPPHLVISIHLNFLHWNTCVSFLHLQPQMISGTRQDFQWLRAYSGFAGAPPPDLSLKKLWKNEGSEQFQHRDSWIVWISAFGFGTLRQLSLEIVALKLMVRKVGGSDGSVLRK